MTLSHSTVTDLFTDIASTIRSKTGSNSPIVADAFPAAINAINVMTDIDRANVGIFKGQYSCINLSNTMSFPSTGVICSVTQGWCDSLTKIAPGEFMDRFFRDGSWTFPNVSLIGSYGFYNTGVGVGGSYGKVDFNFPICKQIGGSAFSYSSIFTINAPKCTLIRTGAFQSCYSLTSISFPACISIYPSAFNDCRRLIEANFPVCTNIGDSAFQFCSSLTTANFPTCTTIAACAFQYCSLLTSVNFPNCTSIGSSAFSSCRSLDSISFPACTTISASAFGYCYSLTTVNFPSCTRIGGYAFIGCSSLTVADFPVCTYIGTSAFAYCSSLTSVSFPACTSIDTDAFYGCRSLTTASFLACTYIGGYAFRSCYNLLSIYLMGSSLCSLNTNMVFYDTPISNYTTSTGGVYGSIYVPASLLASYKTATNWVAYSSRFVGV